MCVYAFAITGNEQINGLLTASALYATTFIYQGSDARLKTNIKALNDPLADIMKLNAVSFDYKSNGKPSIGVIAQDVEKVYPQLVTTGPNGLKAVSYEGGVSPLIGAVQELKKENDELRGLLRAQAARQEKTDQELNDLRSK